MHEGPFVLETPVGAYIGSLLVVVAPGVQRYQQGNEVGSRWRVNMAGCAVPSAELGIALPQHAPATGLAPPPRLAARKLKFANDNP